MSSDKQRWIELLMVVITGCLKFILMDWLDMRAFYIAGICIFWSGYVLYSYSKDHAILKHWGYSKENFNKSMLILTPVLLISIFGTIIFSALKGTLLLNWHVLPILMLYPIWGVIQQFIMVHLIADNLQSLKAFKLKKYMAIMITALIFCLVHQPYIFLMISTFLMEVFFLLVFYYDFLSVLLDFLLLQHILFLYLQIGCINLDSQFDPFLYLMRLKILRILAFPRTLLIYQFLLLLTYLRFLDILYNQCRCYSHYYLLNLYKKIYYSINHLSFICL